MYFNLKYYFCFIHIAYLVNEDELCYPEVLIATIFVLISPHLSVIVGFQSKRRALRDYSNNIETLYLPQIILAKENVCIVRILFV